MKRKVVLFVVALFVPVLLAAQAAAPSTAPAAKPKDMKFLTDYMKQTEKDFLKSIKGLSEAQWKFKAAPDRWSIAEVAEHITLAEDLLSGSVKDSMKKEPATAEQKEKAKGKEDQIIMMITDRSHKAQAPEQLKPTGKFANPKEVEKVFSEKRNANINWANVTGSTQLRDYVAPGPVGELDAYEWLLFMAAHSKRHTLQIEEVKADPNYPKK